MKLEVKGQLLGCSPLLPYESWELNSGCDCLSPIASCQANDSVLCPLNKPARATQPLTGQPLVEPPFLGGEFEVTPFAQCHSTNSGGLRFSLGQVLFIQSER